MDDILKLGWVQFGFAFAFAISGWVVAWQLWGELKRNSTEFVSINRQSIESQLNSQNTLTQVLKVVERLETLWRTTLIVNKGE